MTAERLGNGIAIALTMGLWLDRLSARLEETR